MVRVWNAYFSRAAMMAGGMMRMGAGITILLIAVDVNAYNNHNCSIHLSEQGILKQLLALYDVV